MQSLSNSSVDFTLPLCLTNIITALVHCNLRLRRRIFIKLEVRAITPTSECTNCCDPERNSKDASTWLQLEFDPQNSNLCTFHY